mmetsp:Transcript_22861/g.54117  ORF Transcript_22861/g.54117 Transcript_22861/m.54117 type:complete len:414 (+) Transcript_22861:158-1399(+)|eukprot:CAMPEP_0197180964 /NCGR_PEP_ID=MMETSP1423-20130617/5385_1 /TAXON_ID=476441 /ORGANISM="Pseudo-nitzschia heimii, Strain UNC1101" /LENGTH=413 /DNA_ID=CAMNT_0042631113 /DNA_START=97 /DNA_END=1338 /DNA_ORIENTATION=+
MTLKSNSKTTFAPATRRDSKPAEAFSLERNNSKNQSATLHTTRRTCCFLRSTVLCITLVGLFVSRYPSFIEHNTHSEGEIVAKFDDVITAPLTPEVERFLNRNHYFMFPPANATTDGKAKGILLYLHSCNQFGWEFFTLPEHRIIANDAIQKGLIVFSPTPFDLESRCYTSDDVEFMKDVVNEFVDKYGLRQLPRVGLGDSSGGAFLPFVSEALKLESIAVYNSPQGYGDIDNQKMAAIPTVYLSMSSDSAISNRMNANKKKLQEMNIPTFLYKVSRRPFTEPLCKARLPEIDFCEEIVEMIQSDYSNLVDADGFVIEGDLETKQWYHFFKKLDLEYEIRCPAVVPKSKMKKSCLRLILEQEIQTCYGFHSMTAQYHDEIIEFLMSNSKVEGSRRDDASQSDEEDVTKHGFSH